MERLGSKIVCSSTSRKRFHRTELDSHADTCCVGGGATILYTWPDQTVDVSPFINSLGVAKNAPIVSAGVAYDDANGELHVLLIHQAVYFEEMPNNLLCPMQMRHSGVTVNDCPKHCLDVPERNDHTLIFSDDFTIPLDIIGVTSYFPTRSLTEEEVERVTPPEFDAPMGEVSRRDFYELTSPSPVWNPDSPRFAELESNMTGPDGDIIWPSDGQRLFESSPLGHEDVNNLVGRIQSYKNQYSSDFIDPSEKIVSIYVTNTRNRPGEWSEELLARTWGISRELARRTLQKTTR